MSDQTYDSSYQFDLGDGTAPAGIDPDIKTYRAAPKGTHIMEVTDFDVALEKEFKWKGQACRSAQLRPKLSVVGGAFDGSQAMDFLPMPYISCTLLPEVANQWVNFIQALGFDLPKKVDPATGKATVTSLVPPGFKLQDIKGRRCQVVIVEQTNLDGQVKLNRDGDPMTEPKFFGYSRVPAAGSTVGNQAPAGGGTKKSAASTGKPPMAPSAPAAPAVAPGDFDL